MSERLTPGRSGRILTTHVGSFFRPAGLRQELRADPSGAGGSARARAAVREVVARQVRAGLDLVNDGEQGRPGYADYILNRVTGFAPSRPGAPALPWEHRDFPGWHATRATAAPPVSYSCVGDVGYVGQEALRAEIAILLDAVEAQPVSGVFMTAVSPSLVCRQANVHYGSDDEYRAAVAEALRVEYETIAASGILLQIDCPDIGTLLRLRDGDRAAARRYAAASIELLNFATRNIAPTAMRVHLCCGADEAPHHRDVELGWVADLLVAARPHGLMVVGANGRHEHEWRVWEDVALPDDKVLIPGVVDSTSNIVEHPGTVADRLLRYAGVVGRERVVASVDCGFSASVRADLPLVDPEVAWAKLRALADGAALASRALWS